ncbi:8-oxo-dGTP pyrophosphatase MutT (NUDIX family) [Crossiella equi]|uniref:8-oxo-dGTP pyrophosphatase MutT (NUDIX family) n=1 Tax=Crossiella equi TaxID=130796 RepID=A0ABS5AQH0_9PSEU|nr:NUDIX hydrolase [Crossiella equi]MBP2478464.1 8-oxo-dGTP pyrophosphatase MutT (NUDIX family) [Crossiella equi]
MTTARHSVSVAGVVVDLAGRVMVVQRRDNGHWEIPGGVLEPGETFEAGVRREIAEETGVAVEVRRLTGVYQNLPRRVVALVFRCHHVHGAGTETAEAAAVRWLPPEAAAGLMVPAFAVRVRDAFAEGTAYRAHDGVNLVEGG